ncbi:hypothetical protein BDN71DRAFT_1447368 [Pleurotus eryngii]|uniref:Uncharacterized protein n=1 Tax=Pleurotus eryngii TaxID=5323 RepID=A0A9P5ZZG3_PLEER|nr:hypothetical protein BDN71DRAFT_1447368 [Pleurotus eryngii]
MTQRPTIDLRSDLVIIFLFLCVCGSWPGKPLGARTRTIWGSIMVIGYTVQRPVERLCYLLCGARRDRTSNERRRSCPEFLRLLYVISGRSAIPFVRHGDFRRRYVVLSEEHCNKVAC